MQPLSLLNENESKTFSEKKFENFFKKIWKFEKVALPLQPLSASKIGERNKEIKQTSVLRYNSFFEVFEQLNKFFPSLRKKRNFKNNTFEIRAKI